MKEQSKSYRDSRQYAIQRNLVKNTSFIKLSDKLLWNITELSGSEIKLLLVLVRCMFARNEQTKSIAMIDLCTMTGITQKQNLSRTKKTLQNRGLIKFKRVGLYDEYFVSPIILKQAGKVYEQTIDFNNAIESFNNFLGPLNSNHFDYDRNHFDNDYNQIDYKRNHFDNSSNHFDNDSNQNDALTKNRDKRKEKLDSHLKEKSVKNHIFRVDGHGEKYV